MRHIPACTVYSLCVNASASACMQYSHIYVHVTIYVQVTIDLNQPSPYLLNSFESKQQDILRKKTKQGCKRLHFLLRDVEEYYKTQQVCSILIDCLQQQFPPQQTNAFGNLDNMAALHF